MNYKMVVFDLDGTLLDDKKEINDYTVEIIEKIYNKGVIIIIATGRNYFESKLLTSKLKINKIIMANNGCIVRNSVTEDIIYEKYLDYDTFIKIYEEGKKQSLHPIIHVNEYNNDYDIIIEHDIENNNYLGYMKSKNKRYKIIDFKNHTFNNILSVCYLGDYKKLESFENEMKNKYGSLFNSTCSRNLSIRAILEYMNKNGCKWESIKQYASLKGIKSKEIVTIGDDNNDIEMITNSGLGIAMKNGTKKIKEAADKISQYDNNNLGAAVEIKKIFC